MMIDMMIPHGSAVLTDDKHWGNQKPHLIEAPGSRLVERVHSNALFMALGLAGEAQWRVTSTSKNDRDFTVEQGSSQGFHSQIERYLDDFRNNRSGIQKGYDDFTATNLGFWSMDILRLNNQTRKNMSSIHSALKQQMQGFLLSEMSAVRCWNHNVLAFKSPHFGITKYTFDIFWMVN